MDLEAERDGAISWLGKGVVQEAGTSGRSQHALYPNEQWLSDLRTTLSPLSRLFKTYAGSGLPDAPGGLLSVVCRRGTAMRRGLRICPRTSYAAMAEAHVLCN